MGLQWDKPSTNWCRISSIHRIHIFFAAGEYQFSHLSAQKMILTSPDHRWISLLLRPCRMAAGSAHLGTDLPVFGIFWAHFPTMFNGKITMFNGKIPFLMGKSQFLMGKSPFLMGKSQFLMGKSPLQLQLQHFAWFDEHFCWSSITILACFSRLIPPRERGWKSKSQFCFRLRMIRYRSKTIWNLAFPGLVISIAMGKWGFCRWFTQLAIAIFHHFPWRWSSRGSIPKFHWLRMNHHKNPWNLH